MLKDDIISIAENHIVSLPITTGIYSVYFKIPTNTDLLNLESLVKSEIENIALVSGTNGLLNKPFSIYSDSKQNSKNPDFLHFMGFGKITRD